MAIDIQERVRDFEEEFGSNISRHEKKVAAIPGALKSEEDVIFITDVKLLGALREDLLVVTDSRLLVVRKDGKRIDEYDLSAISSLTLRDPGSLGSQLTLAFGSSDWKANIKSEPAAIALTQVLNEVAHALRTTQGLPVPILTAPSSNRVDLEVWRLVVTFDREYGSSIARHRGNLVAIPLVLLPDESIIFITNGILAGAFRDDIFVCTNRRLLTIRQGGHQVDVIDLHSVSGTTQDPTSLIARKQVTIRHGDTQWQATIGSSAAAEAFAKTVHTQSSERRLEASSSELSSSGLTGTNDEPSRYVAYREVAVTIAAALSAVGPNAPSSAPLAITVKSTVSRVGQGRAIKTSPAINEPKVAEGYQPIAIKSLSEHGRRAVYDSLAAEIGDQWTATLRVSRELEHLPHVMMEDELLLWMASGVLESTGKEARQGGTALIALTDRRILLLDKRLLFGVQTISIDLDRVNSVTGDKGLFFGNIKIQDGADEFKVGQVKNSTIQPFADRVQSAIQERKQALANQSAAAIASATSRVSPPPLVLTQPPQVDVADQLEKLANLTERGILTPEEFAQQKAKLLNG